MANEFNFLTQWLNEFNVEKDNIANKMADESLSFFIKEFDSQQFHYNKYGPHIAILAKWPSLADSTLKNRKYPGEPILFQTGDLRTALVNSKLSASWNGGLKFSVDKEYASYHNDGGTTPNRPPQRMFIGPSYELDRILKNTVTEELKKIFK